MKITPFNMDERNDLLRRHEEISEKAIIIGNKFDETLNKSFLELVRAYDKMLEPLKKEYFDRLPRVVMGCCPFDNKPLVKSFDIFGLDGFWWRSNTPTGKHDPPACPHFCLLTGAVDLNGYMPKAHKGGVHPGPPVPYIIPRLLDYPDMIAVISRIDMENGYIAYPIIYFSKNPPSPDNFSVRWRDDGTYGWDLPDGTSGWIESEDEWDFELRPWVEKGKIKWCDPFTDRAELSNYLPEDCPYVDLPGIRKRFTVREDSAFESGLPG